MALQVCMTSSSRRRPVLCASRYRMYKKVCRFSHFGVLVISYIATMQSSSFLTLRHSLPVLYYRFFLCELIIDAIKKFDGLPRPVDFRSSWIMQHTGNFPSCSPILAHLACLFFSLFVRFHFPCTQQKKTRFFYEV